MSFERLQINIATQNVLLDKTRTRNGQVLPQDYRIESMAATLENVVDGLDIIGIQEAYRSPLQHNGETLATALGYKPGVWFQHNLPDATTGKGRKDEYIGLFGSMVDHAEVIELGGRRAALITEIAGVAFVTTHLFAGKNASEKRYSQTTRLLDAIDGHPDAVLFGDFNEQPGLITSKARTLIETEGKFDSVFQKKPKPEIQPGTWPIEPYGDIMRGKKSTLKRIIGRKALIYDDIYVRGNIEVLDAGVIKPVLAKDLESLNLENPEFYVNAPVAPSDHLGLRARIEIPSDLD